MESIQTPQNWLKSLNEILQNTQCQRRGEDVPLESAYQSFEEIVIQVRSQGKRVWWIGNGGSSALCQHLSQDLLNKLNVKSQTLAEVPLLTCMANDFGYSEIYRRPLRTLAEPGDLLIAVSSSGKSENIVGSATDALERGLQLVTLSAFQPDNPLRSLRADLSFYLSCQTYGLVEVGHEALLHAAIESLWWNSRT